MNKFLSNSALFLKKHSPTILTCVGAVGVVVTAVSAAKATPKAMILLNTAESEKGEKLTKWEEIKTAAPAYIPSVIIGASTIACIFGANVLNKRSQAALASAYALLDSSYKEYKEKTKVIYGEDAHKKITKEIFSDKLEQERLLPASDRKKVFFDFFSLQFFESTLEDIQRAEEFLNESLRTVGYVSLAEYYDQLGIESTDVDCALGWSTSTGCDKVELIAELYVEESGEEHYIVTMSTEPSPNYWY